MGLRPVGGGKDLGLVYTTWREPGACRERLKGTCDVGDGDFVDFSGSLGLQERSELAERTEAMVGWQERSASYALVGR